ncbi:MAG: 23S rRNA (guanosine(2251)-2'-O)-methyltransferase RlmB [Chloroflexi bacterium]|nr:23S rRNA (guanosine(2251)-2'-O)-methyltransferase RlmB [Chloroflexota bacterium]
MEYLYGRNPVAEMLQAGRRQVARLLLAEGAHGESIGSILAQARTRRIPQQVVARRELDRMVGEHHQGIVAEVSPYPYADLDTLLDEADSRGEPPLLLLLDGLQDPQNFGTLMRTALASGVHGVVIPEHRAVGVTPAVSKASSGAVERLLVAQVTNLARTIGALKARNVWVYGLAADAPRDFWQPDWASPVAIVVGAEGSGLARLTRDTCDGLVRIPMAAEALESLNAATAGSLVVYEAFRQRQKALS